MSLFQFLLLLSVAPELGPLIEGGSVGREGGREGRREGGRDGRRDTLFVPKSVSLRLKCSSSTQFSGLMSRWNTPAVKQSHDMT